MNYNGGLKGEETDYNGGLKGEETDYTPPDEPSTFVLARESDDDDPGNQFFGILYLRSNHSFPFTSFQIRVNLLYFERWERCGRLSPPVRGRQWSPKTLHEPRSMPPDLY